MGLLDKKNISKIKRHYDDDKVFVIYPCGDDLYYIQDKLFSKGICKEFICDNSPGSELYLYLFTKKQLRKYVDKLGDKWTDVFLSSLDMKNTLDYLKQSDFDPEEYTGGDRVLKKLADLIELKDIIYDI